MAKKVRVLRIDYGCGIGDLYRLEKLEPYECYYLIVIDGEFRLYDKDGYLIEDDKIYDKLIPKVQWRYTSRSGLTGSIIVCINGEYACYKVNAVRIFDDIWSRLFNKNYVDTFLYFRDYKDRIFSLNDIVNKQQPIGYSKVIYNDKTIGKIPMYKVNDSFLNNNGYFIIRYVDGPKKKDKIMGIEIYPNIWKFKDGSDYIIDNEDELKDLVDKMLNKRNTENNCDKNDEKMEEM